MLRAASRVVLCVALLVSLSIACPPVLHFAQPLTWPFHAVKRHMGTNELQPPVACLPADIIACTCGIVATLNPTAAEHRRLVSMLNFLAREQVGMPPMVTLGAARTMWLSCQSSTPTPLVALLTILAPARVAVQSMDGELKSRVRSYLNQTTATRYFQANSRELLTTMSATLRGDAAQSSTKHVFSCAASSGPAYCLHS